MLCPLRLDFERIETDPSTWPIDEATVKKHCHIDFDDEHANLEIYFRAAVEWAEGTTGRAIISREHRWVLREFPYWGRYEIRLPRGKTSAVDSIQYWAGGAAVDLTGPSSGSPPGSDYQEDLNADQGGVLMPLQGSSWPSVDRDAVSPVIITFTAGWSSSEIPPELAAAIMFATCDAYDMRSSADVAAQQLAEAGKRLAAREALVSSWRLTPIY